MKQEQIIQAARKLFNKFGYKRVSMDEIAKEAGVTKKTVYSYFASKEDLLKYFINEEVLNMKKIVEEVEKEEIDLFQKVHEGIISLLKYKKQTPFLKIIIEEAEVFQNPKVLENLKIVDKTIQNYIREKLEFAKEKKLIQVKDIDITAFLIYKMYILLLVEWGDDELDEEKLADNIMFILKNGLERRN